MITDTQIAERNIRINKLSLDLWDVVQCNDPEAGTKNNRVWDLLDKFDKEICGQNAPALIAEVETLKAQLEQVTKERDSRPDANQLQQITEDFRAVNVERAFEFIGHSASDFQALQHRAVAAEAKVETLRGALKPFAEAWNVAIKILNMGSATLSDINALAAHHLAGHAFKTAARAVQDETK